MTLARYRAKRKFAKTPEPRGRIRPQSKRLIFVVHKHAARHLHYDLRLEMGGVLKSWAVPKEPPMDPAHKRLAVHVEDHPYEYRTFEGRIPAGQYGAGTVKIWDRGTYRPLSGSIRGGELVFELRGKKLKGGFALVQMKGKNWLLIKKRDAFAKKT